jgi:two-component system sensor histidine kinase TctE
MPLRSLRSKLVFWTIAPLSLIAALDVALSHRSALQIANLAQEAQLMGSARIIAEQLNYAEGSLSVSIPPAALELFDTSSHSGRRDQVYYRVSAADGRLLAGYFELAMPDRPPATEGLLYFDAEMRGEPVHAVAYTAPVLASPLNATVLIEVGQTLHSRDAFAKEIWLKSAGDHLLILAAATALIIFALRHALSSLIALRDQVLKRKPGALDALDPGPIPSELKPLVAAINDYIARLGWHMVEHDRFIADASHQLRTPLTVFNTQVGYALQQGDIVEKDTALRGLREGLRRMTRLVSQLLAYTEADARLIEPEPQDRVDLGAVVRQVLEDLALPAQEKNIDLGYETSRPEWPVAGKRHQLDVLVGNLVDNAVRYTPRHGVVTVRTAEAPAGGVLLIVEDNGPGIAAAERERVFERFYRLHGEDQPGCGLGLAIVREIASAYGIEISLSQPAAGTGTLVVLRFPPLPPAAAS